MVKAKKYILAKHFEGFPKASNFEIVEEELPPLQKGEFLAEALYFGVDPYLWIFEPKVDEGSVFFGLQVARIVESKTENFPVGKYVSAEFGWRTHTISTGFDSEIVKGFSVPPLVPDLGDLPLSLSIGILGMPGNAAYFGFLEICRPQSGETVVVTGAGGAVGHIVGQIAKIKGCKVIGIAGCDKKGRWLVEELGFHHFINYKKQNVAEKLEKCAPNLVDCFFDTVGGELSSTIINHMNDHGRVSVCGTAASFTLEGICFPNAPSLQRSIVRKQLTLKGFLVDSWDERWSEGINQNLKWIQEGKLKYKETITEGFHNTFQAFEDMILGKHTGKAIVKL